MKTALFSFLIGFGFSVVLMPIIIKLIYKLKGGQPILSYNYGAGNKERVKETFFTQFKVCICFTMISWLLIMCFPKLFTRMFTNNMELVEYSCYALRIYMSGIFALGFQTCCQQSFMALGQAKITLLLACLRKIILLIPLIFILPNFFTNKVFGVLIAEPISDILAALVTTTVFFTQFNNILNRKKV